MEQLVFSVTQLNGYVKDILSEDILLSDITVKGELSNCKRHSSGHIYFTLKDEKCAVSCAMFKWQAQYLRFVPESGMQVQVTGKITLYEATGQYQIVVSSMRKAGVGELYLAFEQLKQKLQDEGLFDEARKKPIPLMPRRIGVVTSKTGAAVRDIVSILGRRYPVAEVVLCPVTVQGDSAPLEIAQAIRLLNRRSACDVMIVGRGGGSIEDLWGFNSELVARAVARSEIPVISAVGHETDFTICDFVADLRAPTPSAAAELAVPDGALLQSSIRAIYRQMTGDIYGIISNNMTKLDMLTARPCFSSPFYSIEQMEARLSAAVGRITSSAERTLASGRERLSACAARLSALNPMEVLARGFCAVYKDEHIISSKAELAGGDSIRLRFSDGTVNAHID